jgi:tRNA threonylcarbamoyladenosine biosynthesis protein TsaE
MLQKVVESKAVNETEALGESIGSQLKGGEVLELVSDLGGGKTAFTRGLAAGAGSNDHVSSPTFTISKLYTTPNLELHHFDFYRLSDPGLVVHELAEVIEDPKAVVIVEWAQGVQDVLPQRRLTIELARRNEDKRLITMTYPDELAYLVKELPHPTKGNA